MLSSSSNLTLAQQAWADIADQLRDDLAREDKARWIIDACTVLSRVASEIYADTVHSGYSLSVIDVDTTVGVDPSTRHSVGYRAPSVPRSDRTGKWLWGCLCDTLWAHRLVLPPTMRPSVEANNPQRVRRFLSLYSAIAQAWPKSQRAADFQPLFDDLAFALRDLCSGPLAGYLSPVTAERTCSQVGLSPRCRVTPVHAQGMCRRCYDQRRNAAKAARAEAKLRVIPDVVGAA